MKAEEWRPVADWPEYMISSHGRVLSLHRGRRRLMKLWTNANGYLYVKFFRDGIRQSRTVHSLVAEAFIRPRQAGEVVRHLDGSRQHNVVDNLAVGSPSENSYDAVRHGTHAMVNRTHCPQDHEYTAENTRIYEGRRFCKTCIEWRTFEGRRRRGQLLIIGRDPLKPCPRNHGWTSENTYISPQGVRYCRPCAQQRGRDFYARRALAAANIKAAA